MPQEILNQIKADVRAQLSGEWDVSITQFIQRETFHLHKIDHYTTEFHRAHPSDEPPVIWKENSGTRVAESAIPTRRAS